MLSQVKESHNVNLTHLNNHFKPANQNWRVFLCLKPKRNLKRTFKKLRHRPQIDPLKNIF